MVGGFPNKSARLTYFYFLRCTVKVSARLKGAEASEVFRDTVDVVEALRDGSTGNAWTPAMPKTVP